MAILWILFLVFFILYLYSVSKLSQVINKKIYANMFAWGFLLLIGVFILNISFRLSFSLEFLLINLCLLLWSYWMYMLLIKAWCVNNKHIYSILAIIILSWLLEYYWVLNHSINLIEISGYFEKITLWIYSIYFFYSLYLRYWYGKWMSIFMSLPIIYFFSFPIVVLWKGKYIPCDKQDKDTSSSENRQEEITKVEE